MMKVMNKITRLFATALPLACVTLVAIESVGATNQPTEVIALNSQGKQYCRSNCVTVNVFDRIDIVKTIGKEGNVLSVETVKKDHSHSKASRKNCEKNFSKNCDSWFHDERPVYTTCTSGTGACVEVYDLGSYEVIIAYDVGGMPTTRIVKKEEDEEEESDDE